MMFTGRGGIVYVLGMLQGFVPVILGGTVESFEPYRFQLWPQLVMAVFSAFLCLLLGLYLNRGLPRKFIDYVKTGNQEYAEGHTFFFVRMEYGGLLTFPLAFLYYLIAPGIVG